MLTIPSDPPVRAVDRDRAGILTTISTKVVGDLLRLPQGQEVIGARIDGAGDIELLVAGAGMPARVAGQEAARVTLLCHTEMRPGDIAAGGAQRRVLASWAHSAAVKWLLCPWSAP